MHALERLLKILQPLALILYNISVAQVEASADSGWLIRVKNTRNFGPSKHGPQLLEPATSAFTKYAAKHQDTAALQSTVGTDLLGSPTKVSHSSVYISCPASVRKTMHEVLARKLCTKCDIYASIFSPAQCLQLGNMETEAYLEEAESSSNTSEPLAGSALHSTLKVQRNHDLSKGPSHPRLSSRTHQV